MHADFKSTRFQATTTGTTEELLDNQTSFMNVIIIRRHIKRSVDSLPKAFEGIHTLMFFPPTYDNIFRELD